eukprot:TRINITY_DN3718_c2_g1_i1.p2 TRINITY_DN3718_c2_g1~~TRINITY_DN3718_c2_g1_i1.p2  ORF type:complete len:129 (+),score=39.01 TRINITY_DN3718_c2_g1_i1:285-671(+)
MLDRAKIVTTDATKWRIVSMVLVVIVLCFGYMWYCYFELYELKIGKPRASLDVLGEHIDEMKFQNSLSRLRAQEEINALKELQVSSHRELVQTRAENKKLQRKVHEYERAEKTAKAEAKDAKQIATAA